MGKTTFATMLPAYSLSDTEYTLGVDQSMQSRAISECAQQYQAHWQVQQHSVTTQKNIYMMCM